MSVISQERTKHPLAIEWYPAGPTKAPKPSYRERIVKRIHPYLSDVSRVERPFRTRSIAYEAGSVDLLSGGIGFINGINTSLEYAKKSALKISTYAGGVKVQGIYNATHTLPVDVLECVAGHLRLLTPPVDLLRNQWKQFADTHGPDDKYLQIGHSAGAIHIHHALEQSPPELRNKVIVLVIAPAKIIPNTLCHKAYNFGSKKDRVPLADLHGRASYMEQLVLLESHKEAPFNDHFFGSPTFQGVIKDIVLAYLEAVAPKLNTPQIADS